MEKASLNLTSSKNINPLLFQTLKSKAVSSKSCFLEISRIKASRKHEERPTPLIAKKGSKCGRGVISIPASSGKWPGKWTCEYAVSLKDLHLGDLAEDGRNDTLVFVTLSLHKHTGFGLSVDGKVVTSISRKCSSCSAPFYRKIFTSICVWVLPDPDGGEDSSSKIPQIGGDDPSVIYVKPGYEAELDSLIQDTIRLQTAIKETCSELCEKSEPKLHYIGGQRTASLERRWSSLLKLRNAIQQ